jgi:hypothetical protein
LHLCELIFRAPPRLAVYRDAKNGGRRNRSIRLCRGCVDRYDALEAGKKARNTVLAIVALAGLIIAAGYLLAHG